MTDRTGVRLVGLHLEITLTSTEAESEDDWTINYIWEVSPSRAITFIVSSSEVEGLVGQAKERAQAQQQDFSLAEARRQAADTVVVQKIREAIANDPSLAAFST